MRNTAERLVLPSLFVLALLARAPTLGLPLEGDSAVLASVVDHLGHERGWELAGRPPVVPLLGAMLVSWGLPATVAVRWLEALAAGLLAPLLVVVGVRAGLARGAARAAGMLMALHPLALAQAGGLAPGTAASGTALLLGALALLLDGRRAALRAGAFCTLLLPLTDPVAALYAPLLLLGFAARESSASAERGALVIGTALLLVGPGALPALLGGLSWDGGPALGAWLLVLLLGGLAVLWLGLPAGCRSLWTATGDGRAVRRAWLASAALHALLLAALGGPRAELPWRLVTPALPLLPLLVLAGTKGLAGLTAGWRRRLLGGALVGAGVVSLWLVWGGLQLALAPGAAGPAGRLHQLRTAMRAAAQAAGQGGWIVIALAEDRPAEQTSLADLSPGHWTWAHRLAEGDAQPPGLRRLLPFPAGAFESGQSVTVVAQAGESGTVHTFDGAGIFRQELIRQVGPYVVLRAQRP